jgi:signal transduction histidine kinase
MLVLPRRVAVGFIAALTAIIAGATWSTQALRARSDRGALVRAAFERTMALDAFMSAVKDAETGQRGYLLTGSDSYLEPYERARTSATAALDRAGALLEDDREQVPRVAALRALLRAKLAELARTVELRRAGDAAGALAIVESDAGQQSMEAIRRLVDAMQAAERRHLAERERDADRTALISEAVVLSSFALLFVCLGAAALLVRRDVADRIAHDEERARVLAFQRQLVAIVSHDLRSPLSAIAVSASLLKRRGGDEHVARAADRIASAAGRMEAMIGDLLDFTRAQVGGGIAVVREPADLGELAERVAHEQQASVPERRIVLLREGDLSGEWDPRRLEQVIANLVGNAVRHGAEGGEVVLRADGTGEEVALEVSNAGAIPGDLLAEIFLPFKTSRPKEGGLGLGLFIVRSIVEAHGGSVSVDSSPERGTRFTVRLPRREGPGPKDARGGAMFGAISRAQ